jgi:ubiquinone/menaquinone biosynthesis C-methylase UbiE
MPAHEPQSPVQRQFGAIASEYAVSAVHRDGPDLQQLIAAAGFTGRERVLDLGCGAGHTALAAARHAASVVALDLTEEMLAVARGLAAEAGLHNVSFRHASATQIPCDDGAFDVVTSRFAAHHFHDPARAMMEAARVLRPGGLLLLVDTVSPEDGALDTFFNAVELLRDPSHVRNWRVSEWEALLHKASLQPETLARSTIDLDGAEWVRRSRTEPERVAAIQTLFAAATASVQATFTPRLGDGWGWRIPIALIRARKPASG